VEIEWKSKGSFLLEEALLGEEKTEERGEKIRSLVARKEEK